MGKRRLITVSFVLALFCVAIQGQSARRIGNAIERAATRPAEQPATGTGSTNGGGTGSGSAVIAASAVTAATPEAIIAQCPALPSVEQLSNCNITMECGDIRAFGAHIERLRESVRNNQVKAEDAAGAASEQDADRLVRQFSGHSIAELDNMNEAETEAMVNRQLAAAGFGNMTLDRLQALEGKNEAEVRAQLAQSGATATPTPTQTQVVQTESAQSIIQTGDELQKIPLRWYETQQAIESENREAARQIAAIEARYEAQIKAIPRSEWHSGLGSGNPGYVHNAAERSRVDALVKACRNEQYALWRSHTIKMQERIKNIMTTDVARYEQLLKQQLAAVGMNASAQTAPTFGYDVADAYLQQAAGITDLPGMEN
jgi:hypothetical protein